MVVRHNGPLCDMKKDREGMMADVQNSCIEQIKGWSCLRPADITVDEISGGISNLLWKLTPKLESGLGPVVARIFGEQPATMSRDREEDIVLQMNKHGFGAPLLASFDNGRLEGYLDMRTLTPVDLTQPATALRIARRLKQFHRCKVSLPGVDPGRSELFATMWRSLEALRSIKHSDADKQAQHDSFPLDEWAAEMRLIEGICKRLQSPVVWSHVDLLSGNILFAKKDPGLRGEAGSVPSVQFIDFEYSAYVPRGFDWGNHFNEYAGFECEYSRYPDHAHACNFVRGYMAEGSQQMPTDEEVEAGVAEANLFALVSHQYWGVWTLIQAHYSAVEFDYFTYGRRRWEEYYNQKEEFLAAVQPYLKP